MRIAASCCQPLQESVIAIPIASRLARAAINNQILSAFSNFLVKIVHQHAHRCFLLPTFAGERDSNPNCEPPCPCRHKQPDPERVQQLPRQDCSSTCASLLPAANLCRRAWCRAARECECKRMLELRHQLA